MSEVLPSSKRDVSGQEPSHWVQVAEDLYIGADTQQVFLKTASGEIRLRFGPKTWIGILNAVRTQRETITDAKEIPDRQTLKG